MSAHPLDDLEAYAIDALPPDEMVAVATHLAGCVECQTIEAEMRESLALLAFAAPAAAPPAMLEAGILARIADLPPAERPAAPPLAPPIPPRIPRPRPATPKAYPRPARVRWGAAAVGIAAALILVFVGVRTRPGGSISPSPLALAEARAQAAIPHGTRYILHPTSAGPATAVAVIVFDPTTQQGVFEVAEMPALGSNQVYEGWLQSGNAPLRAGIFSIRADGTGELLFTTPTRLPAIANAGISLETGTGVATPDAPMLMLIHP